MKKIGMIGYILAGVFGLVGIVDIFSVISDVAQIRSSEVVAGVDVGKEASSVTESQGLELTVLNPFHLIAAVMFLIWFHRAHRNLARAGLLGLKYSSGWAIGGFFVPLLNLIRPYDVMEEVWRGTCFLAERTGDSYHQDDDWTRSKVPKLLAIWWVSFIVGVAFERISSSSLAAEDARLAAYAALLSDCGDAMAAFSALFLVRRVTQLQERTRLKEASNSPK